MHACVHGHREAFLQFDSKPPIQLYLLKRRDSMNRKTCFLFPGGRLFTAILILVYSITYSHEQISARITASQSQLTAACGTANVKLVFAYRNVIYFVDFSEATPRIEEIPPAMPEYFPVISPDGNWIAYQTGNNSEGPSISSATGTVWVQKPDGLPLKVADTAYDPNFVQNTSPDTPEIIYATSIACPQNTCYGSGLTLKRKIVNRAGGEPALGSLEVVCDKGSYYGGLSWDNRYLNTAWAGGPNAFMLDMQGGVGQPRPIHTMRVKKNGTNIDTFVTIGSSNPSRSASRIFTNTMMYYDFSSSAIAAAKCFHPLLGTWKVRQLLFISRYGAEDLRVYDTPADRPIMSPYTAQGLGEAVGKEWNHPEWSNHPYFAVACLFVDRLWTVAGGWDHTINSESIYLINLKDSLYVKLIESADTSYASAITFDSPFLWVEIPAGFQEDTAWLAKTIWQRAGQAVINPYKPSSYPMPRSAISSKGEIAVYSLSGQKLACIPSARNSPFFIREKLHALNSGAYLVVGHSEGGLRCMYRRVNVR